jgi:hypothetical protein
MLARSVLLVLALAPVLASQQTWTVDDDGPADFVSVQAAVDAATDGDTILVHAGTYGSVAIEAKGLVIQADGPAELVSPFSLLPALSISSVAPEEAVYLRGFVIRSSAVKTASVLIEECDGPVLLEDCRVAGWGDAAVLLRSASVTLSRCLLLAPNTYVETSPFGVGSITYFVGLGATDSNVFLYDCFVRGGEGSTGYVHMYDFHVPATSGEAGVRLAGSNLVASGCQIQGGNGGGYPYGSLELCYPGSSGAPGLSVAGGVIHASSTANLIDCSVVGGRGGPGGCSWPDGRDGPAVQVLSGEVHFLAGGARSFSGTSPVIEGGAVGIHLEGEPGDVVLLHVQVAAAPGLFLAQYAVVLHLPLPLAVVGLGTMPLAGDLDVSIPVPALSPGIDSFRFVGQALFVSAGGFFDGGPSTLLVVDQAL